MKTFNAPLRRAPRRPFRPLLALAIVSGVVATALPADAASNGPTDAQRISLAKQELQTLLAGAPLPPGSRQITATAAEATTPVSGEKTSVYPGNEVGSTKFFVAPAATTSLAWLKRQSLEGHAPTSSGRSGTTSAQVYLLGSTAVLKQPEVVYIAVAQANGTLEYSVTATVWWRSQKPALAVVPPGAAKLVVELNRGVNVKVHRISSATSENRSQIASIIGRINVLQEPSPLPTNCPLDVGATLTMRFYRTGAKSPYSVVVADPGGCGSVTISHYSGTTRTSASDVAGGAALSHFVAGQVGLTHL
jgi:hypothetical protein